MAAETNSDEICHLDVQIDVFFMCIFQIILALKICLFLHETKVHQLENESIHSKSEQIGGDLLLSTEKLAEKVRTSGRQNFAINVRLS